MTSDSLVTRLKTLVREKAANDTDFTEAVRFAIEEASDITTYSYCDDKVIFDGSGCGVTMPCCGIEKFELWGPVGCPDCWEYIPADLRCGKIVTTIPIKTTGKLLIFGANSFTETAKTGANPSYDSASEEWTIYLDGQPDIPAFGWCQICDDIYFYYCKSGTTFTQHAGITEQDWMYTEEDDALTLPEESHTDPDFSAIPGYQPTGVHSALTLRRNIVCSKADAVDIAAVAPGTPILFPLAFENNAHMNMILYGAAENLYFRLIGSCSTMRDTDRYTAMNEYYAARRERAIMQAPKIWKGKVRTRHPNDFRTSGPLSARHRYRWPYYSPCIGCSNA